MLAGIREILIISTPKDLPRFQDVLSDSSAWGIENSYAEQLLSDGVLNVFPIGEAFLGGASAAVNSEDILIYGNDITASMRRAASSAAGAMLFAYLLVDLERYGVANYEADAQGRARSTALVEKLEKPPLTLVRVTVSLSLLQLIIPNLIP